MRETGSSRTLATMIEGESLINDGTAIVIFNVFCAPSPPCHARTTSSALSQ